MLSTITILEVIPMTQRARMVNVTVSIQTKALYYLDEYAQRNRLSRSGAADELFRLARAYLKLLDTQEVEEGDESLEIPSILLKREQSKVDSLDEWTKKQDAKMLAKKKEQKRAKKAKKKGFKDPNL